MRIFCSEIFVIVIFVFFIERCCFASTIDWILPIPILVHTLFWCDAGLCLLVCVLLSFKLALLAHAIVYIFSQRALTSSTFHGSPLIILLCLLNFSLNIYMYVYIYVYRFPLALLLLRLVCSLSHVFIRLYSSTVQIGPRHCHVTTPWGLRQVLPSRGGVDWRVDSLYVCLYAVHVLCGFATSCHCCCCCGGNLAGPEICRSCCTKYNHETMHRGDRHSRWGFSTLWKMSPTNRKRTCRGPGDGRSKSVKNVLPSSGRPCRIFLRVAEPF